MGSYYSIPSKFAQQNLIVSNQMGEICSKNFIVDRETFGTNLFLYVKSGTFHVEQYGKKFTLKSGDCIFMTLEDKHLYYSDKKDVADFFWLHFNGNLITPLIERLSINHELPIVINDNNLGQELCSCHNIVLENQKGSKYMLSSKIYEIFMRFSADALANIDLKASENNPEFIKTTLNYIEQNIYSKISLTELAELVHMDKFYFIQQFVKFVNITPIKYISQRKIQVARMLLKTSNIPINEIAQNLAFFDQSHFNKTFKEQLGISPSTYRKTKSREL